MSPYQHGEVFVTSDGGETDLDLGHYERFIDVELTRSSNLTAGDIYLNLIAKERRGDFLGGTIQSVPHVTNDIKERILRLAEESGAEVIVVEVGGTVGDIEGLPFLEAIRQMRNQVGRDNVYYIHLTPAAVPVGGAGAEDQADAAQRERVAGARDPAGRDHLPERPPGAGAHLREDSVVLRRGQRGGDPGWRRCGTCTACRWCWRRRGWGTSCWRRWGSGVTGGGWRTGGGWWR